MLSRSAWISCVGYPHASTPSSRPIASALSDTCPVNGDRLMRPQSHMLPGTYLVSTWRIAAGISRAPTLEPDAQTISTQARCSNGQAGCQHKAQAGRGARIHTYTYIECRLGLTATYLSAMRGACSARQVPCTVVCTVLAGMYVSLHIAAWLEPDGACPTHKGSSALFFTPLPPVPLHCWWCRAPTLFPHGTTNTAIRLMPIPHPPSTQAAKKSGPASRPWRDS